jgi:hypothetical protein
LIAATTSQPSPSTLGGLGTAELIGPGHKNEASRVLLDPLGRLTPGPIMIQPVPVERLGEPRPPLALTCDEDPSLSVALPGDEGFFIPDWPFGGAD